MHCFFYLKLLPLHKSNYVPGTLKISGNQKVIVPSTLLAKLSGILIVAVVEVVAKSGGAQAVARLADELNRTRSKWDYCISDPTSGSRNKSERYAFLWKTSKLKKWEMPGWKKHIASKLNVNPTMPIFLQVKRNLLSLLFMLYQITNSLKRK